MPVFFSALFESSLMHWCAYGLYAYHFLTIKSTVGVFSGNAGRRGDRREPGLDCLVGIILCGARKGWEWRIVPRSGKVVPLDQSPGEA